MTCVLWTIIGFVIGWIVRGQSFLPHTTAETIDGDDFDHNHGSRR